MKIKILPCIGFKPTERPGWLYSRMLGAMAHLKEGEVLPSVGVFREFTYESEDGELFTRYDLVGNASELEEKRDSLIKARELEELLEGI